MVKGLGERLQKQRLLLNISQKEAAIVIGASASVISNYESGERTPRKSHRSCQSVSRFNRLSPWIYIW